jgi:hypothetical protein
MAVAGSAWDIVVSDGAGGDNGFPLKALWTGDGVVVTRTRLWSVRWGRYHYYNKALRKRSG